MGFFGKGKNTHDDFLLRSEFNKVAHAMSTNILRSVDGSNPDELRLIMSAKKLGDLANSNAMRQLTASCLLATCREVIETVDLSNERERHLYYDALDLVEQFESTRSLCA